MKIIREGFKYSRKRFSPPKSPKGFAWPKAPTAEDKRALGAALQDLSEARGLDRIDLGKQLTGVVINASGVETARDGGSVSKWWKGEAFPREEAATMLAAYFKVPVADLLKHRNGQSMNGHHAVGDPAHQIRVKGGKGKRAELPALEQPPPLPLPEGAKPAFVKFGILPGRPALRNDL